MENIVIHHFFSSEEIENLVNDSVVQFYKEKLSSTQPVVKFSISLADNIKQKLEQNLSVGLSQVSMIPMRWVYGDTHPHIDQGESSFHTTNFIYLTDGEGQLIVDNQSYPIVAGDAHIFSEGLEHSTIDTGNIPRLIMGPMSETGFPVGIISMIYYFPSIPPNVYDQSTSCGFTYWTNRFSGDGQYPYVSTILNLPPPIPTLDPPDYVTYWNNTGSSDADIWAPPSGKKFGGWKLMDITDNSPIGMNTADKIYMPGEVYNYGSVTILVPNWIDSRPLFQMHFTDNALVYYKPHSLSTGGGGSGVRNCRHKQFKT